jgi:hypothetical protein
MFVFAAVVGPLLHAYVYGAVPPAADTVADPSAFPQLEFTLDVVNAKAVGSSRVVDADELHALASVVVNV